MQSNRCDRGILDTSTVILLARITDATQLPAEPLITAVTLAELTVGPLLAKQEATRADGRVASSLRRSGRKANARALDAMIAATAIANDLPVYTCNPSDFAGIDDLDVVEVPHPDHPRSG